MAKIIFAPKNTFNDYPDSAVNNANKVVKWLEEHGEEMKGLTRVGKIRAHQIANRRPVSRETVGRIAAFARHEGNSKLSPENRATPWKDKGYVAWLAWGGTSMINWAKEKLNG